MAAVTCRKGHTVEVPGLQCWCGELPPHALEGDGRTQQDQRQSPRLCGQCGIPLAGEDVKCWECGVAVDQSAASAAAVAVALVVRFPWGEWRHPGGVVLVGRHPDSPLAGPLADYLGVSRRHAYLTCGVDGAFVSENPEEPSRHGTFVDGRRVAPGAQVSLADGNTLRLGIGLTARIVRLSPL